MRLYCLEIKHILKSRRTLILLTVALIMSIVMAYLPVMFESINRPNADGTVTELNGMEAIRFKRAYYSETYGTVTPQKVADALQNYQSIVKEYGSLDDVPLDIYIEHILAIRPLLKGLTEAFGDSDTGMAADIMEISPDEVAQSYYEKCAAHLNDVMENEQKDYPTAWQQANKKYAELEKPFQLYYGISRDAFDYVELYIFILSILSIAIAAPVFAGEYQTGSDNILRCTKYGRAKLAITKIFASGSIFAVAYVFGIMLHLLISDLAFGTDCLKSSFQMLFSIINLPNINLGQLQIILALVGLLSVLACVCCTLFLSAKCKDALTVLLISIAVVLIPTFAYTALGVNWISAVLPSAGIGMQNNFLYQLLNFNYLHIGEMSFWTPHVILISAAIEIPVFLFLAIRSYCKHQVA